MLSTLRGFDSAVAAASEVIRDSAKVRQVRRKRGNEKERRVMKGKAIKNQNRTR